MLCYFGDVVNNVGADGLFMSVARSDKFSRAAISCGNYFAPYNAENYVNSVDLDDGILHHIIAVFTGADITFYVDGVKAGMAGLSSWNSLSKISPNYAFLGKSGYVNDPTWVGSVEKFSIYQKALSEGEVLYLYQEGSGPILSVDKNRQSKISVYPNPVSGYIFFNVSEVLEDGEFSLTALSGQVVFKKKIIIADRGQYDVSTVPPGIYMVKIRSNTVNHSSTIVKN